MQHKFIQGAALQFVNELTARRAPPQALKGDPDGIQAELDDLVATVVRVVPWSADLDTVTQRLNRVVTEMRDGQRHRTWPTAGEVAEAVRRAFPKAPRGGQRHPSAFDDEFVDWAVGFVRRGYTPPTAYWDEAFACFLLDSRRITYHQLQSTGWLTPARRRAMGFHTHTGARS